MDEHGRQARYESMRKGPGRRISRNKKLFMDHMDLEKQCKREIKRYEFDTRVATADISKEKILIEKKQDRLRKQQERCELQKEKTRLFLDSLQRAHTSKESKQHGLAARTVNQECVRVSDRDIIHTIGKLAMPARMKQELTDLNFRGSYL